ncbi:hypothetical protein HYH02_006356 [Chlamydomonas schloesseri]|uniref:Radical SAM core domain-containing protein n=1 Tax=Chlamydomonas schloesseri TaxID=2026947 RepID=A0A836B683_9CHLO|nr:hypothetical protein HYH02_006356 [Chlamydomonas schloesseri]|eukprot:KAG2448464.1 hypothetical protein HYH02_006356 [Chlamydomonas schloesseri]
MASRLLPAGPPRAVARLAAGPFSGNTPGQPLAQAKAVCLCAVGPSTSSIELGRAHSYSLVAGTALARARAPCARSEGSSLLRALRSVAPSASLSGTASDSVAGSVSAGPGSSSAGFGVGVSGRRYRPAGVGLSFSGGAAPSVREGSRSPDRDASRASLPNSGSRSASGGRSADARPSGRFAATGAAAGGPRSTSTSTSTTSSGSTSSAARRPAAPAAAPATAASPAGADEGLVRSFRSPRTSRGGGGSSGGGREGASSPGGGRAAYEREERRGAASGGGGGRDSARGSGGGSGRQERDGEQRRHSSSPRQEGRGSDRGRGDRESSAPAAQRRPDTAARSSGTSSSRPSGPRGGERPRAADPTALAAAAAAAGVAAAASKAAPAASTASASAAAPKQAASSASAPVVAAPAPPPQSTPAAELVAIPEGQYPTYVPRNPGISDGEWNARDKEMVTVAQRDAAEAVTPARLDQHGTVILGRDATELEELAARYGQPRFRAKQLLEGVLHGARSVEDINTIPKAWRAQLLADGVRTGRSLLHHSVGDADGTRKFLLQLADGRIVETVGIPTEDRLTVCVSSQVGCPMRCTFCATGKGGFARNLAPHEILDQVLTVQELYGRRVTNVVFMGMGEPLLNLPSVTRAYHGLNKQIGIGGAYITISTVGVPNSIRRLAEADTKATLAVSLHAPSQALREAIIPSAKAYPIEALLEDCAAYFKRTGRRVTFEYTLLSGVNDEVAHAQELVALLQRYNLMSHVNVIPWNPVDESEFKRPSRNRVFAFTRAVEAAGLPCTVRETRGLEAAAACGQLRNQFQKTPLPQFEKPL